jgi:DNA-directed RNA polymerase beta subunit
MPQKFITSILDETPDESRQYDILDFDAVRSHTMDNIKSSMGKRFPLTNSRYTMHVNDLEYDKKNFYTPAEQKDAILNGKSLGVNLKGRFSLVDNVTGKPVSETSKKILLSVPYLTERGTYIRNGHEMTIGNILRLQPGVYSRVRNNGQVEAHINPEAGSGMPFKVEMNPEDGVFSMRKQNSKIKLYPLLKQMGITDFQLEEQWGKDILQANMRASEGSVKRTKANPNVPMNTLAKTAAIDDEERPEGEAPIAGGRNNFQEMVDEMANMKIDPQVTKLTLGREHSNVNPYLLMDTSKKLLGISRGEQEVDTRDSMEYQKIYGAPELFAERVAKDGGKIARNLLWKATNKGNLDFIGPRSLNKHMDAVFNSSGLGQYIEGTSPMDALDGNFKVTRLGEGGIGSMDAAPEEARYVRNSYMGFIDPIRSPESIKVGLDMFLGQDARKGSNGLLYNRFYNPKTKKVEWVDSKTAALSKIATTEQMDSKDKYVPVLQGSKGIKILPKSEVDYFVANPIHMFSPATNMVPMLGGISGMRANMGSRYLSQAIPLATRESPLVTTDTGDGTGQHAKYAKYFGAKVADAPGVVTGITEDEVTITGMDGTKKTHYLYNNFPANQKGYLRSILNVKQGQTVKPGDLIASSNYTDSKGHIAVGLNLRTGYMPYKGLNYEDGIVISEDAAQRLSSEHMSHYSLDIGSGTSADKKKFLSVYPGKFTAEQYKNIQDNGVAKKGTVLHYGDPIILGITENEPSPLSMGRRTVASRTETWDKEYPGVVTDASSAKGVAKVFIRSNAPMQVGDKLSNAYGAKGVIAHIVPQTKMPMDAEGKPLEVLMNPLGLVGRANPAQIVEGVLGKIAAKTGKQYILPRFPNENLIDLAQRELDKHGMKDTEDLINPETGKVIPQVFTGVNYYMKLKHTSDSKKAGRGTGGYTVDEQPAQGGEEGSKRFGLLEQSAMVGHGAMEILKDAKLIRGQQNDDFWRDFRMGKTPVMPGEPLAHKKFFAYMQGAGINVRKGKNTIDIFGMTDKDVDRITGSREVKSPQTYDAKSYDPIPGGLFGRDVFGPEGDQWGHIKLPFAIPNPVMEDSIKKMLNLTGTKFDAVLAGQDDLNGLKGPEAIGAALKKIDIDRETVDAMTQLKSTTGSARDKALKRYRALASIKAQGLEPSDFMLTKVPVVPPAFRPISTAGSLTMVSDVNYLYKQLMHSMEDHKEASEQLPKEYGYPLQSRIYNDYKSITGLSQPDDVKLASKNVGGLLQWVFGKGSPKYGAYQRKLIATSLDTVGRSVITPNPSLKMNEVGLPEKTAWTIYEPFVVRDLVKKGYPVTTAVQLVTDKAQPAYSSLKRVIEERPVIINRAPSLHKFSLMAFWPKLTKGNTLQIPPPIVEPFNADFDGDTLNYHVPVSSKAVQESIDKMLPENNLLDVRSFKAHYKPIREYAQGIYIASKPVKGAPQKTFATEADAMKAYKKGEIDANTPIKIGK